LFSPILYFTAIMLPEPQTAPKTHKRRIIYGIFVAVILALGQNYISAPYTLEASLLIGNVFVWAIYRDKRYILEFIEKKEIAPGIYNFWFKPRKTLEFTPGQFFEWTVYHKNPDSRGIRRYFTIASFPGEKNVLISAKVPQQPSTFKNKLLNLEPGDSVSILGPQGDFVIQDASEDKKFAFIAGGIGITPFRSMVKDMEESNMSPDIGILYFADSEKEFVFEDTFKNAEISYNRSTRRVNAKLIKEIFPDYNERIFYVSGPDPMVRSTEKILTGIGVKDKNIKTDYFPGYEEI
ncbi:MAG: hypothetical protein R3251_03610, partial [Candidatus Spechtbacterales bacterium]|nr:hypothetical protein [Candidatus Spechtbacterales bacterium]